MKTTLSESAEFKAWLEAQNAQTEYDGKTIYYRNKMAERDKRYFLASAIVLVVALNLLIVLAFV